MLLSEKQPENGSSGEKEKARSVGDGLFSSMADGVLTYSNGVPADPFRGLCQPLKTLNSGESLLFSFYFILLFTCFD